MGVVSLFKKLFVNPNKEQQQEYYQDAISASAGSTFVATEKNIIKIPEFMSAIDMIANDIADVKWYDSRTKYTSKYSTPYEEVVKNSNWNVLLNKRPNDFQSSTEFWKTNILNLLIRGAFYFYIYKDNQGRPKELIPIHPNSIQKAKDKTGKYFYRITLFTDEYVGSTSKEYLDVPYDEVFSTYWFDLENISDMSFRTVYSSLLEQLGLSNNYNLTQLNQSPRILAHIKVADKLEDEQKKKLKKSMQTFFTNAKQIDKSAVLVTDPKAEVNIIGSDKTQISSPLSKEFTESLMVKLANALHIPLPKLNIVTTGQSFYKSREGINIDYVSDAIRPIALKIADKLSALIYPKSSTKQFIFKLDKLLMVDHATRGEYISKMMQNMVMTQNEARVLTGLKPVEDGDVFFGNGAMKEKGEQETKTKKEREGGEGE